MAGLPVARRLLSDDVYDRVRARIVKGELAPGTRVVESVLARQLQVSQAPVREALKRLAHEGLVNHVPRRGNYVAEVPEAEASAAREVRAMIEEFAARGVATQRPDGLISELRGLVDGMREAAAAQDIAAFREADLAFHRAVCHASPNPFVGRMWTMMEASLRTLLVVSNPLWDGSWTAMSKAHDELIGTLASGDADRAAQAFHAHALGELCTADDARASPEQ
ncbi:FCD domain-containing protein [Streptomyces sp. SID5474]|nr:FCD domain-containing protein [Streptomyces sp. SID5474]